MIDFSGRLIVHIGPHKTGSTSIQLALDKEYERLREVGILYPKAGRTRMGNRDHLHHQLFLALIDKLWRIGDSTTQLADIVCDLKREVDKADPHSIIISDEAFAGYGNRVSSQVFRDLQHIFPKAQRTWVAYLRRQDDLAISRYAEHLKAGLKYKFPSIHHVARPQLLDHRLRLERLASAVTEDQIVPVSFDARKGDLVESFFEASGITPPSPLPRATRANKSLPWRTLYCLRYAHALPNPLHRYARWFIFVASRRIERSRFRRLLEAKPPLTREEAEDLRDRYVASNRWVEETYWDGARHLTCDSRERKYGSLTTK